MILFLTLTLAGSAALFIVTVKYYWGERGTPPATGDERRRQREREIALRAKQFEKSSSNPIKPRKPSFWDNSKED